MTDKEIETALDKAWKEFVMAGKPAQFHDGIRDALVALGKTLGFKNSAKEYRVEPVYPHHQNSYIDVVWRDTAKVPRLTLEIDDGSNPRAIRKLLGNPSGLKLWFCYGPEKRFLASLARHAKDRAQEIRLIVMPAP